MRQLHFSLPPAVTAPVSKAAMSVGPVEEVVVPVAQLVALTPKIKAPTSKPLSTANKGKEKAIDVPAEKKLLPPTKRMEIVFGSATSFSACI